MRGPAVRPPLDRANESRDGKIAEDADDVKEVATDVTKKASTVADDAQDAAKSGAVDAKKVLADKADMSKE